MKSVNSFFLPKNNESFKLLEGTIAGVLKYSGGAYCPVSDRIYFAPWQADKILELNPNTDTWQLVGDAMVGLEKFSDFVYVGDGKMVGIPLDYSQCILFDTATKSITPFGLSLVGDKKWYGGSLSNNGYVYATPYQNNFFLKIDPVGLTSVTVGASITGSQKMSGLSLVGEDLLLAANRNYAYAVLFDSSTDTWSTVGLDEGTAVNKYWSSHAHPNGKGYIVRSNFPSHKYLDLSDLSVTLFNTSTASTNRYYGMGLAPNGYFYTTPASFNYSEKFLPDSSTRNLLQLNITGNEKYLGSPVLAPNGCFYFAPYQASRILKLSNIGTPISSMFEFPLSFVGFHTTNWNIYQNRY